MAYVTVEYMVDMLVKIAEGYYGPTQYAQGDADYSWGSGYSIGDNHDGYWCFDCCGVVKAVCGGWNGNGMVFPYQNGVFDGSQDTITDQSAHSMSTIDQAPIGAALRMIGRHVGIYIGNDKAIECSCHDWDGNHGTTGHLGGVQVTQVSTRGWDCWDYVAFVDYSTPIPAPEISGSYGSTLKEMSTDDWRKAFVAEAKSMLGTGYDEIGGCSSYVSTCLGNIGYCSSVSPTGGKYFWAAEGWKGILEDTSYFSEVSTPQEGDIIVHWGTGNSDGHTGLYGDGGTYEAVPGPGAGHGSLGGVIHVDGVCSCLSSIGYKTYRMVKSGGTLASGAAWTGTPSGSGSSASSSSGDGQTINYSYNLHKYTVNPDSLQEYTVYKPNVSYITNTIQKAGEFIVSDNTSGATTTTRGTSLLSTSTLVESPFVAVQIGNYLFGSYNQSKNGQTVNVQYPNYVTGMTVTKINGSVNTYTINMTYQIQAGDNPNMIDEILSSVGYGTIYITYGDWNMPSFIYKEESALITKVSTQVNFANYSINYTINCTSNSIATAGLTYYFPRRVAKPSTIIATLLQNASNYGLKEAFPGLYNDKTKLNKLLTTLNNLNDASVEIVAKECMNSVAYINYLVTCMIPDGTSSTTVANASYYMVVIDDAEGTYFEIKRVECDGTKPDSYDVYEVDIGYPDLNNNSNVVFDFSLSNDNSWALLYNYGQDSSMSDVVYKIDNDGTLYTESSQNLFTKNKEYRASAKQQAWWTNMTQFPVNATLKVKGLLRPQMLMSYVRVNTYFYGHKHVSSGLYVVTKQVDEINGSGYRTTLSLTRIAGDNDTIAYKVVNKVVKLPVVTVTEEKRTPTMQTLEDPNGMNWQRSVTYTVNGGGSSTSNNGGTTTTSGSGSLSNAVKVKDGATLTDSERDWLLNKDNVFLLTASYMKGQGYKKNAGIGVLAYIYNEGRGLGFYSYENYWNFADPLGQVGGNLSDYKTLCTSNDEWTSKYLTFENAYKYQPTCPCLGMGLMSESNVWSTSGELIYNNTDVLIATAKAQGVCWYDPSFYIPYSIDRWTKNAIGEQEDWADPLTFTGTAAEYSKRVLCAYGMPGWRCSTVEALHPEFYRYWNSDTLAVCEAYWDQAESCTGADSNDTSQADTTDKSQTSKEQVKGYTLRKVGTVTWTKVKWSGASTSDKEANKEKIKKQYSSVFNSTDTSTLNTRLSINLKNKGWDSDLINFAIGFLNIAGVKYIANTDSLSAVYYAMACINWITAHGDEGLDYMYKTVASWDSKYGKATIKARALLPNPEIKAALYTASFFNITDMMTATSTAPSASTLWIGKTSLQDGTVIYFY